MRRTMVVLAVCLLAACSSAGSTGPAPGVAGHWRLSFSGVGAVAGGDVIECQINGMSFDLTQADTAFSGTYAVGGIDCSWTGGGSASGSGTGAVIDGLFMSNSVAFDLDAPDCHFSGTYASGQMHGMMSCPFDLGPPHNIVTIGGNWAATR